MRSGGGGGSDGWALGLDRQSYLNRAAAAAKVAAEAKATAHQACTGATTIHTIGNNHLLQTSTYCIAAIVARAVSGIIPYT
jgi:hypothetical protein